MSISHELQKLGELYRDGTLSQEEFEVAKRKVLAGAQHGAKIGPLEELRAQNELAQLDREWAMERENYMIAGKYGNKHIPGKASSLFGGLFVIGFGFFWTVMAFSVSGSGPFGKSLFPLFGIFFILVGAGASIRAFVKAGEHELAQDRYRRRRQELLNRQRKS